MIPEELIQILACPECKGELLYLKDVFVCENCMLKFEIIDDIPDFLPDDAQKITQEELEKLKNEG
ncbi:Trm112 family protein [Persephonella sp.]|uniref:Trm112 family protein n=1 Tax=Persephonella sp. TaxID=2060922 RepID=UPI0026395B8D|nr:Trm112 family protein [Persephonella sp.]